MAEVEDEMSWVEIFRWQEFRRYMLEKTMGGGKGSPGARSSNPVGPLAALAAMAGKR